MKTLPLSVFLLLVALIFLAYYPAIDNYFTFDDYFWLQRGATLIQNPSQMFNIDVIYFDPLVYITFWLNFKLAAFNSSWYHIFDLILHIGNSALVYILVSRISKDAVAAVISASIFAITFSTVDAIVWSSSRVDTQSLFCCLASIILYSEFIERGVKRFLIYSLVLYVLALCSKGTPSVLPLILVVMTISKKDRKPGALFSLIPHIIITCLYFTCLAIKLFYSSQINPANGLKLNFYNFMVSFSELFIPERLMFATNHEIFTISILGLIVLFIFNIDDRIQKRTAYLGVTILLAGLAPVLVLADFNFALPNDNKFLLSSPSHRIYLASVGYSILAGMLFSIIWVKKRMISIVSLLLLLVWNIYEIRQRERIWDSAAIYNRKLVAEISELKGKILSDGVLVVVNFDLPRGFLRPILDVYCGAKNVLLLPMTHVPNEILEDPNILRFQNRGQFLIYGKKIYDFSNRFNQLLSISYKYQVTNDSVEKTTLLAEYQLNAKILNAAIDSFSN